MQIKSKVIGIDLGTTNCAVAIMTPGDDDVVLHQDPVTQATTTPSVLYKDPSPANGTSPYVVGLKAAGRVGTMPEPIRSIKSRMGEDITVLVTDEQMSPEQVSKFYLEDMKRRIENEVTHFDGPDEKWIVERAVVTVPAYFDQPAIEATTRAAEMAGLELVTLLKEPTAAARYHCWRTNTTSGTFLVYDFGGGTFDVSILRITDGTPQELGISGHNRLGGDQIDEAIAEHIRACLVQQGWALDLDLGATGPMTDKSIWALLKLMAEKVKKGISDNQSYILRDELRDQKGDRVLVEMPFDRPPTPDWSNLTVIEQLIYDQAKRTIPYCDVAIQAAIEKADVGLDSIDAIIFAGGSTHLPLVREMVKNELCPDPDPEYERGLNESELAVFRARSKRAKCAAPTYEEADTIVARGAAIEGAANGLHVYNEARDTRVRFLGAGLTSQTESDGGDTIGLSNIGAVVERRVPNPNGDGDIWEPVTDGVVELRGDAGEGDEVEIGDGGRFHIPEVEIDADLPNVLEFIVRDQDGEVVTTVTRQERVANEIDEVPPTLTKAIGLEVVTAGQLEVRELIPALTPLPAGGSFEFGHPGTSEVHFSVFQNRRRICTIKVKVPEMAKGTPIKMSVNVDKMTFITSKGTIGETPFDFNVAPPPPRQLPTDEERKTLEDRFGSALEHLAPAERMAPQLRWANALKAFENALATQDENLAVHNFEEMEEIVDGIETRRVVLNPNREQFEELVESCLAINNEIADLCKQKGLPHDKEVFDQSIQAQRDQGLTAYKDSNQAALTEATEALQRIRKTLVNHDAVPDPTQEELALYRLQRVQEETTRLMPIAERAGHGDLANQMSQMVAQLPDLFGRISTDPGGVQGQAAQMQAELERIKSIVDPESQLPPVPDDIRHKPLGGIA